MLSRLVRYAYRGLAFDTSAPLRFGRVFFDAERTPESVCHDGAAVRLAYQAYDFEFVHDSLSDEARRREGVRAAAPQSLDKKKCARKRIQKTTLYI